MVLSVHMLRSASEKIGDENEGISRYGDSGKMTLTDSYALTGTGLTPALQDMRDRIREYLSLIHI
jgi:hypothetical protein